MTAPTGMGQYVKPTQESGDRLQAQQMVDRPMLVWVRETKMLAKTQFSANGGEAVFVDLIDLQTNDIYIRVMWMAGAIKDGLKQYAGDNNAYPVKIIKVKGGAFGYYNSIEPLDEQWTGYCVQNLAAFSAAVAAKRAEKEAEWAQAMTQQPPGPPGPPAAPPLTAAAPAVPQAPVAAAPQAPVAYAPPAPPVAPPVAYTPPAPPAAPAYVPPAPPAPPVAVAPPAFVAPAAAAPPAPPAPPVAAMPAPPVPGAMPTPPGTVSGETVDQLQARLAAMQ